MEKLLYYGSVEAIPLYNCSGRTPEEWSLEGVPRPITGFLQISYGVIVDLLNLVVIKILSERACFKWSCFKIMLLLAIIDSLIIPVNSILTGYLSIQGAVFCSHPLLIYISGSVCLALWCSSCLTALLLVSNRLLIMRRPTLESSIFNGNCILLFLTFPLIYGAYFLFTPPLLFNSKLGAWFFDPMIYPNRSKEYDNVAHKINNILIVALTCLLCIPFQSIVRSNINMADAQSKYHRAKLQVLSQSILICVVNQTCAIIYVVMNLVTLPPYIIIFGHFLWQFIHGAPVFIYLLFNEKIQKRFLELLRIHQKAENNVGDHCPNSNLQRNQIISKL